MGVGIHPSFLPRHFTLAPTRLATCLSFPFTGNTRAEGSSSFVPKYFKILSAGGSRKPRLLMEAGIDISRQEFWQQGFDYVQIDTTTEHLLHDDIVLIVAWLDLCLQASYYLQRQADRAIYPCVAWCPIVSKLVTAQPI